MPPSSPATRTGEGSSPPWAHTHVKPAIRKPGQPGRFAFRHGRDDTRPWYSRAAAIKIKPVERPASAPVGNGRGASRQDLALTRAIDPVRLPCRRNEIDVPAMNFARVRNDEPFFAMCEAAEE